MNDAPSSCDAEHQQHHPLYILYTSGTTENLKVHMVQEAI